MLLYVNERVKILFNSTRMNQIHTQVDNIYIYYTCPKGMWIVGVREEVVGLCGPREIQLVEGVQVARRSRVEHLNLITLWDSSYLA